MSSTSRVNFALCWHMHQPWYQQGTDGDNQLPWVYLHAIKDYADMLLHLESHPKMHVVINFAPVLLEQLDDYSERLNHWLSTGTRMRDSLLNLLAGVEAIPSDLCLRYKLLRDCRRAYAPKMIDPYPAFKRLLEPVENISPANHCTAEEVEFLQYLDDQYFVDVVVWYHLAWLGYALKQTATAHRLIKKARLFNAQDCRELVELMHDCIASLIPRYRALAERGQIELSMTPYGHPIIPLLNDMYNMKCSQPGSPMPASDHYPGGVERSAWHIEEGIRIFEHYFGKRPKGIWLSEGAISEDAIALIEKYDFEWTASGEGVWRNSVHLSQHDAKNIDSKRALFHPYTLAEHKPRIFFRDDGLSDLIGFDYSRRESSEAAEDLVQNLVNIAEFLGDDADQHVVTIILDGENAWEYYPHNGYYFLDRLYTRLSEHTRINTELLSRLSKDNKCKNLKKMCPGSWVYGSFSTWIGEEDKNRAWELLVAAKKAYDSVMATASLNEQQQQKACRQLAICEGSDWFWWFGQANSTDSVSDFDILFRIQLKDLYKLLSLPIPDNLDEPVSYGSGSAENAGTMRRNVG